MAITADKTTNVIKVTGTTNASQVIDANKIEIQAINWFGESISDGHLLALQNANGDEVFGYNALADDQGIFVTFPFGLRVDGLSCDDMDGGELHIYLK